MRHASGAEVPAVTFAVDPGKIYLPLEEAVARLRWRVSEERGGGLARVNGVPIPPGGVRLGNGIRWVHLHTLAACGAEVVSDPDGMHHRVRDGRRSFIATAGAKQVEIDLARQRLYAWQGRRLVLETKISSGRGGGTPAGNFTAGPYKSRMHYSSRYHNAPMPWSVQVNGHIFIHGFSSVPDYPASHGCIRVPLSGGNPARFFYEWVDAGTPIRIVRGTKEEIRRALPAT